MKASAATPDGIENLNLRSKTVLKPETTKNPSAAAPPDEIENWRSQRRSELGRNWGVWEII